jgi:hypothetical protein
MTAIEKRIFKAIIADLRLSPNWRTCSLDECDWEDITHEHDELVGAKVALRDAARFYANELKGDKK